MLIGHSMPEVTNIALAGGSWLTSDGGAALFDGKPARVARLNASGTPAITATFAASFKPRIVGVLGLKGVEPGAAVRVTSPASLGGNAGSAVAVRFADGTVGAWIVTDGEVSTSSLTVTVAGAGAVDIGELVAMPAGEVEIERAWEFHLLDPTELTRGRASQVTAPRGTPYRTFRAPLAAVGPAKAQALLGEDMSWQQLQAAVAGARRAVGIPRWRLPDGSLDESGINSTAIYGICRLPLIGHMGGNYFTGEVEFEEVPAIP